MEWYICLEGCGRGEGGRIVSLLRKCPTLISNCIKGRTEEIAVNVNWLWTTPLGIPTAKRIYTIQRFWWYLLEVSEQQSGTYHIIDWGVINITYELEFGWRSPRLWVCRTLEAFSRSADASLKPRRCPAVLRGGVGFSISLAGLLGCGCLEILSDWIKF